MSELERVGDHVRLHRRLFDPKGLKTEVDHFSLPAFDAHERPERIEGQKILSHKFAVEGPRVLFSKLNPRINRVWNVQPSGGRPSICSTEFAVLEAESSIIPAYLTWMLRSPQVVEMLVGTEQAATKSRQRVDEDAVLALPIRVPPLGEQRRIVAALTERRAAVAELRTRLFQDQIEARRLREIWVKERIDSTWYNNPLASLGELLTSKPQYGLSVRARPSGLGLQMLKMNSISRSGYLDLSTLDRIDDPIHPVDKFILSPGDVLFNRTNSAELVGKSAVFRSSELITFASYLIRLRPKPHVDPDYLCSLINSHRGRAFIEGIMGRAIGQVNVSASKLIAFEVPYPPLQVQERLVAEMQAYARDSDTLEGTLSAQLTDLETLDSALLRAAFSGQL